MDIDPKDKAKDIKNSLSLVYMKSKIIAHYLTYWMN